MSAAQNRMTLLLQSMDSAGSPIINRSIGPVSYDGAVGAFYDSILPTVNATPQTLPTAIVLQLYFRNTHATAVITVTWTPQGGASVVSKKVAPGGFVAFHDPANPATAGITALSLQSDTINATYEMFLGG